MAFSDKEIILIYRKTNGRCHICGKKLAKKNYGILGARGAWEVEHSNPRSAGGTDHLNNLYPSCIACNREKGAGSTRAARAQHGRTKAPLSYKKRQEIQTRNTFLGLGIGAGSGAIGGAILGGPAGLLIGGLAGSVLGTLLGRATDPE